MKEQTPPSYEASNTPEEYIPFLDNALGERLAAMKEKERSVFYKRFSRYHKIAYFMVRYAVMDDIKSYSVETNDEIINPQTGELFTFEELGFKREDLSGSTAGSFFITEPNRVRYIPLVAMAMYEAVEKRKDNAES